MNVQKLPHPLLHLLHLKNRYVSERKHYEVIFCVLSSLNNIKNIFMSLAQGCQIFLGTKYKTGRNIPNDPQNIPNGHEIFTMAVVSTKWS
jgi:hypothetical protein